MAEKSISDIISKSSATSLEDVSSENVTAENQNKPGTVKPMTNLWIDTFALIVYLVAANPAVTGLLLHEWFSLAVVVVFIVHVATHFDWVIDALKRGFTHPSFSVTGNLLLNVLIIVLFMIVTISGIMVSRHALPLFGLVAPGYFFWNPMHSITAKMLLALIVVHVVIHWKWFLVLFKGHNKTDEEKKDDESESVA